MGGHLSPASTTTLQMREPVPAVFLPYPLGWVTCNRVYTLTLLCYPGEVQGPFTRVLQLVRVCVRSLTRCRWRGMGDEGIFSLPIPPCDICYGHNLLSHSHDLRASSLMPLRTGSALLC